MSQSPSADCFPLFPASWYLFGAARALAKGPVSRDLLGRRLVAFRGGDGRPVVLEGRCAHLGADLGEGRVVGGRLQCAFHHWEYDADGRCARIPASAFIPPFARLCAFPTVERHGLVFFFNGSQPLFPLPFFPGCSPDDFAAAKPLRFFADCPWYLVNANSFDAQHFRAAHDREILGEPVVDCPAPFARRIRATFAVTGRSIYDRLLRRFAGGRVEVSMTNWGGSIVVVTGRFRRTQSRLITYMEPLNSEHCVQNVVVHARRGRTALGRLLIQPLMLRLRRRFTRGFMEDEFTTLAGIRYNPGGLLPCDRLMIEFFRWVCDLPQSLPSAEPGDRRTGGDPAPRTRLSDLCTEETTP
jgi:nitrite reductase/ring-hydroxylating ferredoxin subunit